MPEPPARSEPTAAALLPALIELFRERGVDRLATEAVVAALGERLGRPITANRLTRVLGPCGVRPRQFRLQGVRVWGYLLSDLAEPCDAAPPGKPRAPAFLVEAATPRSRSAPAAMGATLRLSGVCIWRCTRRGGDGVQALRRRARIREGRRPKPLPL